ncbi:hypothetical protein VNO78_19690 [Psophocarpus tetragonolobus]|uniref:Uncharacterized protein n=1 Tax=Psophocarpus tetragonolobus TaxID=3891 RepID=A0AAN9S928_PSOTE
MMMGWTCLPQIQELPLRKAYYIFMDHALLLNEITKTPQNCGPKVVVWDILSTDLKKKDQPKTHDHVGRMKKTPDHVIPKVDVHANDDGSRRVSVLQELKLICPYQTLGKYFEFRGPRTLMIRSKMLTMDEMEMEPFRNNDHVCLAEGSSTIPSSVADATQDAKRSTTEDATTMEVAENTYR